MTIFFDFFARVIAITIDAVTLLMLIRAVTSWFLSDENKFFAFVFFATEIFVVPVRFILSRFKFVENSRIDWSFMIAYFLLVGIRSFLPAV